MSDTAAVMGSQDSKAGSHASLRPSRSTLSMGLAAVINQSIFSLGNFASTVIVGKFAGETELGIYALALAAVYLAAAVQRALVAAPYTVQVQSLEGMDRTVRRGSALVQVLIIGLLLCLAVAALTRYGLVLLGEFNVTTGLLIGVTASWGLRDFCRRVLFADLRFREAVAFDGIIVTLQIVCLCYFTFNEQLSATTALQAIFLPSAVVTSAWLVWRRSEFRVETERLQSDFRASWQYGRWSTLTEGVFAGQDFAVQALLAASSSFATTGIYAACMSIVKLINPLVQALGNFVGPRSAKSFHHGGVRKLAAGVRRITWFISAAMLSYLVIIFLCGGFLLETLYSSAYAEKRSLLVILSLAAACGAIGMGAAKGISAMEKPQLNLLANVAGFAVVLTTAWLSFETYNVYGVAIAILTGAAICCLCKWALFRALIIRQPDSDEAP